MGRKSLTSVGGGCAGKEGRIEEIACRPANFIHTVEIVWPDKPFTHGFSRGKIEWGLKRITATINNLTG